MEILIMEHLDGLNSIVIFTQRCYLVKVSFMDQDIFQWVQLDDRINVSSANIIRIVEWEMNIHQALSLKEQFLRPRQGSKPQPSVDRWDTLTIELPRLRWWANVQL